MDRLGEKVAIVTGGAGGIGAATCRALARHGASVVVLDVDEEGAAATVASITGTGGVAEAVRTDLTVEADVERAIASTVERFGRLDVVHNNAALTDHEFLARDTAVTDMTMDVWERTISVNLTSQMLMCKHAVPAMVAGGGGSIINMSSGARSSAIAPGPPTACRRPGCTR